MEQANLRIKAATYLVSHLRRCLTALVDGTPRLPRRDLPYWIAKINRNARFWRYPIITRGVLENCSILEIDLGKDSFSHGGVFQLCSVLKAFEEPLLKTLPSSFGKSTMITSSKHIDWALYKAQRFHFLSKEFANMGDAELPGVSLLLHGSLADLQYTAFSDVDDVVILRKEAWQDPSRLIRTATLLASTARAFQNVDPYQHHGHWVITEFDLLFYDQSNLPIVVLSNMVHVTGESNLAFRVSPDQSGFVQNAVNTIRSMQKSLEKARLMNGLNAFELKGLVGEIAIMPAYIFQSKGEIVSKPEAIRRACQLFSPYAMEALVWATFVRDNFAPLVDNTRTKALQLVTDLACPRRHQAEALFRKCSVWVNNRHRLGIHPRVRTAVETLIQESKTLIEELSS